jgi:hypothetical protein
MGNSKLGPRTSYEIKMAVFRYVEQYNMGKVIDVVEDLLHAISGSL